MCSSDLEESPKTEAPKEIKSEAPKQEENKNIDPLDMPMQLPLEPIETPKEEPKKEIVDIQKELEAKFDELFGSLNDTNN